MYFRLDRSLKSVQIKSPRPALDLIFAIGRTQRKRPRKPYSYCNACTTFDGDGVVNDHEVTWFLPSLPGVRDNVDHEVDISGVVDVSGQILGPLAEEIAQRPRSSSRLANRRLASETLARSGGLGLDQLRPDCYFLRFPLPPGCSANASAIVAQPVADKEMNCDLPCGKPVAK